MDCRASFLDGISPLTLSVTISRRGDSIAILGDDSERTWDLQDVQFEYQSDGKLRIHLLNETLIFTKDETTPFYKSFPEYIQVRKKQLLIFYAASLVVVLVVGILSINFGNKVIADLITHDQELFLFSGTIKGLEEKNCASEDKIAMLKAVVKELDKEDLVNDVFIIPMDVPNAFAYPGGIIVFTTGFFKLASNPDELVGVMAHEIMHIKHRHHIRGFIKNFFASVLITSITGGVDSSLIEIASGIAINKYNVKDEIEADKEAAKLLSRRGITSKGMASFFSKLGGAGDNAFLSFFSTHPSNKERVDYLKPYTSTKGRSLLEVSEWKKLRTICEKKNEE